jgi:AAA15 family ATPase/GTPase
MYITHVAIKNYASLKNVEFEGQPFLVFIGPNGQGKSLIFEALYRFFSEFNPIGGGISISVND